MLGLILDTEKKVVEIPERKLATVEALAKLHHQGVGHGARVGQGRRHSHLRLKSFPLHQDVHAGDHNGIPRRKPRHLASGTEGPSLAGGQAGRPVAAREPEGEAGDGVMEAFEVLQGALRRFSPRLGRTLGGAHSRGVLVRRRERLHINSLELIAAEKVLINKKIFHFVP